MPCFDCGTYKVTQKQGMQLVLRNIASIFAEIYVSLAFGPELGWSSVDAAIAKLDLERSL